MTWEQFIEIGNALVQFTSLHDLSDPEQDLFRTLAPLAGSLIDEARAGDFAAFQQTLILALGYGG